MDKNNVSITIIIPPEKRKLLDFSEIVQYHELLYFLTWRDIKVRYKQALLGVGWVIIQPILTMIIFTVIFGKIAGLKTDNDIPYPLFTFVGILPWQLFAGSLSKAGNSLVANANLLKKVYCPRILIPIASILPGLVDFFIAFGVLICLMIYYSFTAPGVIHITWTILLLPVFVLLTLVTATAIGLWLAAINVKYRDVKHTVPFIIQIWMYISPVAYSASFVPSGIWRILYGLNPVAGIIQGFRWVLLGGAQPDSLMLVSLAMIFVVFLGGLKYFRKTQDYFADIV